MGIAPLSQSHPRVSPMGGTDRTNPGLARTVASKWGPRVSRTRASQCLKENRPRVKARGRNSAVRNELTPHLRGNRGIKGRPANIRTALIANAHRRPNRSPRTPARTTTTDRSPKLIDM